MTADVMDSCAADIRGQLRVDMLSLSSGACRSAICILRSLLLRHKASSLFSVIPDLLNYFSDLQQNLRPHSANNQSKIGEMNLWKFGKFVSPVSSVFIGVHHCFSFPNLSFFPHASFP